jgi:hypothetical protein
MPAGPVGRVFTTTMGASTDLASPGLRRLIVNAAFWCLGMEQQITPDLKVDLVGEYKPNAFSNNNYKKRVKPADLAKP